MALTKPPVLPAWAEAGDKVQPSNAEIQAGWPLSNVPPARQRWNWILNFVANGIRYLTRRGLPDWAADETYEIGDCARGPDGLTYKSKTQNINKTPAANQADWELWGMTPSQLNAAGLFTTAAQFDNTTKVCTTAHAKAAGKRFAGLISISANGALTTANAGRLTLVSGNGLVVDLPAASTFPAGECVTLLGAGWVSANTIQRAGTDAIYPNGAAGGITSFPLDYGDTITLMSNGVNSWYVSDGTAMRGLGCSAQSWQNVTASRAAATTYTNTTGRPISLDISVSAATTSQITVSINGVALPYVSLSVSGGSFVGNKVAVVPPGATYSVAITGTISSWFELR